MGHPKIVSASTFSVVRRASKLLTAGGVVTCAVEPNLGQTDSKWATRKGREGSAGREGGLSDECDWSYGRNGGPLDRMDGPTWNEWRNYRVENGHTSEKWETRYY